jgi:hypothetical protein
LRGRSNGVKAAVILRVSGFQKLFTRYSHRSLFALAAGLRLETARKIDKKKAELYFWQQVKKILTEKRETSCPKNKNFHERHPKLTQSSHTRILAPLKHDPAIRPITMRPFFVTLVAFFLAALSARAADDLLPPFGFRWNDSTSRVENVLNGAKARIISRDKKENRDVWTVEGLVHPGLKRTLFTFKGGALFGVELQYEYQDRTIEWYNTRMGEIRRYFDAKFGTGKLVSRSRDTDSDVIQTLVGYQWMVGTTMLELFYFSAERGQQSYRTISVDYKAL